MKLATPIPFILASTSPRRIELMEQVHLDVEVQSPDADETPKKNEKPDQLVKRLATEKADSVREKVLLRHPQCIILAADTIVVAPDGKKILGKPKDSTDAVKMLKLLAGKVHTVFTGYCILKVSRNNQKDEQVTRVVQSRVKMRELTTQMIDQYIATGEPMDKAGSYAAQGLGMALIERLDGSYTNVVGLPVSQVLLDLEEQFKIPFLSWMRQ
jgi:septum formation protein